MSSSQIQRSDAPSAISVVAKATLTFAQRHYIVTTLYILGMFLIQFGIGFAASREANEKFESILSTIDHRSLGDAQAEFIRTRDHYNSVRGFFSCDEKCQIAKQRYEKAQARLEKLEAEKAVTLSEAKAQVGLFSEYGIQETRELFWGMFARGKQFAKNASWWDLLFAGIGSVGRDEGIVAVLIRWVINVLMNITLGLFGALIGFMWSVVALIRSYQPDLVTGVIAFILFSVAAISMVATVLLGVFGLAGTSAYMVFESVRANNPRLRDGGSGGGGFGRLGGDRDSLPPGTQVVLTGLNRQEYNGRVATVLRRGGDRIAVILTDTNQEILVRPDNIRTHAD